MRVLMIVCCLFWLFPAVIAELPAQTAGDAGVVLAQPLAFGGRPTVNIADFDGDGVQDLAQYGGGSVVIISGATFAPITAIMAPTSVIAGVCDAGDVNNDGTPDIFLAGGQLFGPTPYLISGANSAVLWSKPGFWSIDHPSASILAGGVDLDGSGTPDVVYCARTEVRAYSGDTGALLWPPLSSGPANYANAACIIPSVDGDALPDIVIGLKGRTTGPGKVRCISGATGTQIWEFVDTGTDSEDCGQQVSSIGDLNGDGFRDILVSERRFGGSYATPQALSGLNGQHLFFLAGTYLSMANDIGDMNFDGIPDIGMLSGSGSIMVSGLDGSFIQGFSGGDGAEFVTTRGDVSGDGVVDMLAVKDHEIVAANAFGTAQYGQLATPSQPMVLDWSIAPANPTTGSLNLSGWAPFAPVILVTSRVDFVFNAGGTTILVDYLNFPATVFEATLDSNGSLSFPMDLIQPSFTGRRYFVQGLTVSAGLVYSSNGLEMKFLIN